MRISRLCLAALLAVSALAQADHFQFVVAGDGRANPGAHRPEDVDGVNTLITGEMEQAVLDEHAKFLLWTGDLVYGSNGNAKLLEKMLLRWRGIMQPLYDKKIPVLPCRGNHEFGNKQANEVWNKVFSGEYALPQNGPSDEMNLTFYFKYGPVLAVGMDQYTVDSDSIAVNVPWLKHTLDEQHEPFIFTYGHEPAFMDGAHKDLMDNDVPKRDSFWDTIIAAGSRVYFCGHDHLYDHMTVLNNTGKPGPVMHQIVAGTSGAPFYTEGPYDGANSHWKLTRVKNITKTYGYVLVDINGNKATVTFKGRVAPGKYKAMDSFSFTVPNS
jgi:hypothetical protein